MIQEARFSFPTDIRFGPGSRSALRDFAKKLCVVKPLLVTDSGLLDTEAFSLVKKTVEEVWPAGYALFSGVTPNPTDKNVEEAWKAYSQERCDAVIGLGGGSPIDTAKAMRLKAVYPERPFAEISLDSLPERLIPFCAIPTTAGTGSEVGRSSVITVAARGRKIVFGGPSLIADLAILDPELTVGLPPHLTAATGMDVMTHAVESYVSPAFHPMCDAVALEAIRYVRLYLPRAYRDGKDIEARGMMQIAAAMGAVAFQKDLGAAHSMSHALSAAFGVQHGLANAIALPAVIRFNGEENSGIYERVAEALGIKVSSDPATESAEWIERFNRSIGITQKLRDLGVPKEKLPELADAAMEDECHKTNPRPVTRDDMLRLFEAVW